MITNSAVMTMTSGPHETKPITRGAWLAGVIFNSPPPPPPAGVPPLPNEEKEDEGLTLRQRFSAHRERADCAGCHEKLDPLGFALENFDPVGRWRDEYENGLRVDSDGVLFRRHEFGDVVEFKDAILKEKERFVEALAGHLLTFALGRELTPSDSPALDEVAQLVSTQEYRMKALIKAVAHSEPFSARRPNLPCVKNLPSLSMARSMKSFSRRNFLRGMGGSILALPSMESLATGPAKGVAQRMAFYYVPIGVVRRTFFPGEENGVTPLFNRDNFEADETKTNLAKGEHPLELTATLKPLERVKDKVSLITGMDRTFQ